jgi:hypothetical protein
MKRLIERLLILKPSTRVLLAVIQLAAFVAVTQSAAAANRIWIATPTDGNWSTAAYWDLGTAAANDAFVFTNSSITSVTNDALAADANLFRISFPGYRCGDSVCVVCPRPNSQSKLT